MRAHRPFSIVFGIGLVLGLLPSVTQADVDVFGAFTTHIQRQIRLDKQAFVTAQVCTQWFYKELYRKPERPQAGTVALVPRKAAGVLKDVSECRTRYPEGLDSARQDSTKTQSTLSLSLTFYELALVGDRDDDGRYNDVELRDVFESFGLPFNEVLPPSAHVAMLTRQFDGIQEHGGLEAVMTGMGLLYDRGYRLSQSDRAAIANVTE
ncbi:hypothetical protein [Candidatus Nitrospira bockiana]